MNLQCMIIEDEPLASEKLEGFVAKVPFLNLVATFDNALDGLQYLKTNPIDLLFLDIQMEQLNGIQLLGSMAQKPYVIITSAYSEYALKGYELQVFDYLLKPYSFDRFLAAVNHVCDDWQIKHTTSPQSNIFVKSEYHIENIPVDDILYVEGMQGYLRIVLPNKKIMTKQSFKAFLDQLPSDKFAQVHKSWIVAISKIESIERGRIRIKQALIPISETYKESFYKKIGIEK
jgi:two-component system, LytTR family, response regulator